MATYLEVRRNATAVVGSAWVGRWCVWAETPAVPPNCRWELHVYEGDPARRTLLSDLLHVKTRDAASGVARVVAGLLREADPLPLEAALAMLLDLLPGEPVVGEVARALAAT